jgi:effector-binding domain-containing protein
MLLCYHNSTSTMKILKTIGLGLLAFIALLVIVSFFLPSKSHVERSIVIESNAEMAFDLINDLHQWKAWSPWHALDTNAQWTFSEVAVGKDAWYTWKSENSEVGKGKLTITESKPGELIMTALEFDGMNPAQAGYYFTKVEGGTKITWTLDSDMGMNPKNKYFGLIMDKLLGPMYEKGLAAIKKICESTPKKEMVLGFEVEKRTIPTQKFVFISNKNVKREAIGTTIGESFLKLDTYVKKSNNKVMGYPFTTWYNISMFNAALPVAQDTKGEGDIKFNVQEAFEAMVVKYYGAYDKNEAVYQAMDAYMKEKGLTPGGPPTEVYVTDPMVEKDTTKWLTEMVFPVKN